MQKAPNKHPLSLAAPRFIILALCLAATSCSTPIASVDTPRFSAHFGHYHYASLPVVKQSSQRSCGAASLSSVLQYWQDSTTEKEILENYPAASEVGYPLWQLRRIARKKGVWAFILAMEDDPEKLLSAQIAQGRPIITPIRCPYGRYFGEDLPVIGKWDSRTVTYYQDQWKAHYVVVFGEDPENWLLMDPAYGIVSVSKRDFEIYWRVEQYAALLITK